MAGRQSMAGVAPLPEIVQIIPAQGYVAVYRDEANLITAPVAVWALVRHTKDGGSWNTAEGLEAEAGGADAASVAAIWAEREALHEREDAAKGATNAAR